MNKRLKKQEAGSVLIMAMVVLVMLTLVGLMAIQVVAVEVDVVGAERRAESALYIAEAGIQYGLQELDVYGFSGASPNYAAITAMPVIPAGGVWAPTPMVGWHELHDPDVYINYPDAANPEGAFRVAVKVMDPPNDNLLALRCLGVSGHPDEGAHRLLEVVVRPGS